MFLELNDNIINVCNLGDCGDITYYLARAC